MATPGTAFTDPKREEVRESNGKKLEALNRARRILATYYIVLPFVLIYLLFKLFPPYPWPSVENNPKLLVEPQFICFFFGKLCFGTTLEERLLLLVIVAGALGSYIHSATSYSDYRGNRQFNPSWLLWYLVRPLVGICLALVVYFAVRGGLLLLVVNGSEATEARNINPFGVAAVSGLTGMFSKQAADKLAEVFTTLFKSQGDENRKDSLTPAPPPVIKKIEPDKGSPDGGTELTITGTGFVPGFKLFIGEQAATDLEFVSETIIKGDTPAGKEGAVDVVVVNSDGQKATAAKGYTYVSGESRGPVNKSLTGSDAGAAETKI